jgi:hypothetical protein
MRTFAGSEAGRIDTSTRTAVVACGPPQGTASPDVIDPKAAIVESEHDPIESGHDLIESGHDLVVERRHDVLGGSFRTDHAM